MTADPSYFIHPGFGKSGTTSLQDFYFGTSAHFLSIGRPYETSEHNTADFCTTLRAHFDAYDPVYVSKFMAEALEKARGRKLVLSDELLARAVYQNQTVLERLKDLYPKAKIIFTLRNQVTALQSYYAAHGRMLKKVPQPYQGRHIRFDDWLDYVLQNPEEQYSGLICYKPIIDLFKKSFGEDAVHILLFEELKHDLESFAQKLGGALDENPESIVSALNQGQSNKRVSENTLNYIQFRQRFLPSFHLTRFIPFGSHIRQAFKKFLSKGSGARLDISPRQQEQIHKLYSPHNRGLAQDYGLDLSKWDYPL